MPVQYCTVYCTAVPVRLVNHNSFSLLLVADGKWGTQKWAIIVDDNKYSVKNELNMKNRLKIVINTYGKGR